MSATQPQPLDRQFTCMIAALRGSEGRGALAPIEFLVIAALIRILMILERIAQDWRAGRLPPPHPRASLYRRATPRPGDLPIRVHRRAPRPHTQAAPARHAPARPLRLAHAPILPGIPVIPARTPSCARPAHVQRRPPIAAWRATRPRIFQNRAKRLRRRTP